MGLSARRQRHPLVLVEEVPREAAAAAADLAPRLHRAVEARDRLLRPEGEQQPQGRHQELVQPPGALGQLAVPEEQGPGGSPHGAKDHGQGHLLKRPAPDDLVAQFKARG